MNPWESIDLSDYENHMKLDSVFQLQTMNSAMKSQFDFCSGETVMVFGIAGGNGLEHVAESSYSKVYGIDINSSYIEQVKNRYSKLGNRLECICLDIISDADRLPHADSIIANLFVEYVGYESFVNALNEVNPKRVSVIVQINLSEEWVSDSPYIHSFDCLEAVHHLITEPDLIEKMSDAGFWVISRTEYPLPNGKALVQVDFERNI